ncbi:SRPBCC family protein [Pelagibacterium mangrovi]|uniref:SRPBCC family protein n=1 Tax=Pelagibacterium mangrovi TaxID=3119828 RepID=UPI002FCCB14D
MTERNVIHATFTLERTYKAPRSKVFTAFSDIETKRKWFGSENASMDFRVGGREHSHGVADSHGRVHSYRFDAIYLDIIENERIIYAYDMDADSQHISASLTTIELTDTDGGTRLKLTEQGAFLDGYDDPKMREVGTVDLLANLAKAVEE